MFYLHKHFFSRRFPVKFRVIFDLLQRSIQLFSLGHFGFDLFPGLRRPLVQKPGCRIVRVRHAEHRRLFLIIDGQGIRISTGEGIPNRGMDQFRRHARETVELLFSPGKGRQRAEKASGIRMFCVLENFPHSPGLADFSRIHDSDPVCSRSYHAEIMGNQHDRRPQFSLDLPKQSQNLGLDCHIKGRSRLIRQKHRRLRGQGNGKHAPLPHSP